MVNYAVPWHNARKTCVRVWDAVAYDIRSAVIMYGACLQSSVILMTFLDNTTWKGQSFHWQFFSKIMPSPTTAQDFMSCFV
ncbi:hypothetical protein TNCV_981941 [Trichonephila clavipes]|nr:hypothetical protein TNCV_981941 [Trichonephila clavipes]